MRATFTITSDKQRWPKIIIINWNTLTVSAMTKMWKTMERIGLPEASNWFRQQTGVDDSDDESAVNTSGRDAGWFKIDRWLHQGCILWGAIFAGHIVTKFLQCLLRRHHEGRTEARALEGFEVGVIFGETEIRPLRGLRYACRWHYTG